MMRVGSGFSLRLGVSRVLDSITALFLVLNCQSVWQNTVNFNFHIYEICFSLIIINCLYSVSKWRMSKAAKNYVFSIGLAYYLIILFIVIFSVPPENLVRFLSRFLIFPFFLLYLCSSAPIKRKFRIFESFTNWVAIISWISVLFWVTSTLGLVSPSGLININWFGLYYNYYNLYFSSWAQCIDLFHSGIRRNIGIFTEGPMFMFVLVLSLLLCLLIKDYYKQKKWKIVGIVLALLFTVSVTGYVFALLIGGTYLIHKYKNKKTQILIGIVATIIVIVGGSVLLVMKSGTASYVARIDDYIVGLQSWTESPLIGSGYENTDILKKYMSRSRIGNQGFSNTVFSVLTYGGVLFAIPFVGPVIRGCCLGIKKHDYRVLILSVVYIGLYFTVIFYTFYINFLMWALFLCIYKEFGVPNYMSN